MTVVCCWWGNPYGRERITLLADTRAAVEVKKDVWKPLDETTTKLFRVPLVCHDLMNFDRDTGALGTPYFETSVAIGFAGYCFEALTIIAHVVRCFGEMVAYEGGTPRPCPEGIAELIRTIVERYFAQHKNRDHQVVDFLAVGFSPVDGKPWGFKIRYRPATGSTMKRLTMGIDDFYVIGSMAVDDPTFRDGITELRQHIEAHRRELETRRDLYQGFELELEKARHDLAEKKIIEDETRKKIDNPYAERVGGILQKMEVLRGDDETTIISFTRDDRPHLYDGLPEIGHSLGFIPVIEGMGRRPDKS
jgi:hypothetical protein